MEKSMAERLIKLRLQNNLSQSSVAKRIGSTSALISAYEKQERNPSIEKLIALADVYHTTTDYILGRTNEYNDSIFIDVNHLTSQQIKIIRELVENMNQSTEKT